MSIQHFVILHFQYESLQADNDITKEQLAAMKGRVEIFFFYTTDIGWTFAVLQFALQFLAEFQGITFNLFGIFVKFYCGEFDDNNNRYIWKTMYICHFTSE